MHRVLGRCRFLLSAFSTGTSCLLALCLSVCLSLPEGQIGEQYHIIVDDIDAVSCVVFFFFLVILRM